VKAPGPETTPSGPASAQSPCPVRDPEDGSCYSTADEADLAWIARGTQPLRSRHVALPPGVSQLLTAARTEIEQLPVEDDPDGDEPIGDGLYPEGSVVPAELPSLSDEQKSFWKDLGRTLRRLVVRKKDSKPASIPEEELAALFATGFPLPIEAFPKDRLRDTFDSARGRHRRHHAIDLGAPRGTPIVAVNDGTIERLGRDRRGGIVVYQRDVSGRFVYYYAHLARYVPGLKVGESVKRGEKIGEVGATGRASGPHLHFAIFRDADAPSPWKGLVVNPYLVFSILVGPK
jgi:murein DD-endopeptidase MepM/ murein hydrolase activator NlpD